VTREHPINPPPRHKQQSTLCNLLTFVHAVNGDFGTSVPDEDSGSLVSYSGHILQALPLVPQLHLVDSFVTGVRRGEKHQTGKRRVNREEDGR